MNETASVFLSGALARFGSVGPAAMFTMMLAAPVTAEQVDPNTDTTTVLSRPVPLAPKIHINLVRELPGFVLSPDNPDGYLDPLLSSTGNWCEGRLLSSMEAYEEQELPGLKIRTTFTLMPRNQHDVRIISGVMCLPPQQRAKTIVTYYRRLGNVMGRYDKGDAFVCQRGLS